MEDNQKESVFDIKHYVSLIIVLIFALVAICFYAWNFEKGIPIFSGQVSDWSAFATYLSGMVSPFIALLVLFYVVRSYSLQKVEFSNVSKEMRSQLEIDCLLRRQDSIMKESNRLIELVLAKLGSKANISDAKYLAWYANSAATFPSSTKPPKDVKFFFEVFVSFDRRGNFPNGHPDFPDDFDYLIELIGYIDSLFSEIRSIDQKLKGISTVFSTHVSDAFLISSLGQIGDLVVNFRRLEAFNTNNKDYLRNF